MDLPVGAVVKNLPAMKGTRVQSLVREDPKCCGATKPVRHNYWACALEPVSHNEARAPTAHALQQDKPPQWEAHILNKDPMQPKINKNKLIN